ncbi:hypothetical protein DAPPUDRAFT_120554 [Daphnia pulex]|uniref:Uncharacterized protein n=1 Tax=Daphnia pulex TaxID=6669 RepID=E9I1Q7_DAPPU|nr:hypothetical protein DAPPUDRAFT_120554 [Daphnia pulex]|eukprot:EFX62072.1 hypothetical protein DAPPUDRAFT_120554 [Daphnia pulex]
MENFASTVSSKEFDVEFTKLLDEKIVSLTSPVEDPDIDQETKLFKCRGTAAFKCHNEMGPYHLEVKGEKCDPSYNQWVQLWKLLSCSDSAHVDSIDISLNDLIKTTKWEGIVPEKYFKMPNTVGMGNARCLPSAFTSKSVKQKLDDQGSQGGSYTPLVTLIHRIVYVYTKGKPIFISMIHPSGFVVSCYGLMEWITALENYSVDLRDIYFLFYGLKLAASKTLKEPTCISCLQLKTAIEEKIPLVDGAAGASGVLFSFRTAFYARKIWGNQIGRSNFSDSEDY